MGPTGTFKTTRFSDLLRYYSASKDTATVRIQLGGGEPDGIFRFVNGELVEGWLQGVRGREALRRALELRDGSFAEDPGDQEILDSAFRTLLDEEAPLAAPAPEKTPSPTPLIGFEPASLAAPAAMTAPPAFPVAASAGSSAGGAATARAMSVEPTRAGRPLSAVAPPPMARSLTAFIPVAVPEPAVAPPVTVDPVATSAEVTASAPAVAMAADPVTGPHALAASAASDGQPFAAGATRGRRRLVLGLGAAVALGVIGAVLFLPTKAPIGPGPAGAVTAGRASPSGAPRGVLPDRVILGMVSSFSGSNKERGRAMRIGWEAALAEANDAGGIHGRKVSLVVQDDGYDPGRTLAGMKAVVEEGSAFAIVGNVGTATAAVAIPYASQNDAVFFGALSGGDFLRKIPPDRHVFNFRASLAREAEAAVRYLVQVRRLKPKHIAVLAQDDEFGASGRRGALRQLDSYGVAAGEVLQLSYPRNTADVNDALAKLRVQKDIEAVVMVATYKPAATFVRKVKDAGIDIFFTTVSADSAGLAEELAESGPEYTRGVLLTQVVPVPTSHATTLVRYRQVLEKYAPGEKPSSTSLEAWIGAQIFLEAMRRAGRELDTPKLIAALEGINDWDIGIGGNITFGPADHQGCDVVWGWLLQPDGSYRQIDLE